MRKKILERELNHPHFVGVRLSDIELDIVAQLSRQKSKI